MTARDEELHERLVVLQPVVTNHVVQEDEERRLLVFLRLRLIHIVQYLLLSAKHRL